jgi:flavin reductase (DIM6/NTAB) family NADH-FMN oxidoreductase RutF
LSSNGSPILDSVLAWFDCRLVDRRTGGDHTIFIGEVNAAEAQPGEPLMFWRGRFHHGTPLPPLWKDAFAEAS